MAVMSPPAPADGDADTAGGHRGRADRLAKAVLVALALAFVMAVVDGAGLGGSGGGARLGGDYPAFHAAGSIVLDGELAELYDADRQQAAQTDLGVDGYLAFAFPTWPGRTFLSPPSVSGPGMWFTPS